MAEIGIIEESSEGESVSRIFLDRFNNFKVPYFYCPNCKAFPKIQMVVGNLVKISCDCFERDKEIQESEAQNMEIEELSKFKSYTISLNRFFELIEKLQEKNKPNCWYQHENPIEATQFCTECQKFFCKKCHEEHNRFCQWHTTITSRGLKIKSMCENEHCGSRGRIKYYCEECKQHLCSECIESHVNHKKTLIEGILNEATFREINRAIKKIDDYIRREEGDESDYDKYFEYLEKKIKELKDLYIKKRNNDQLTLKYFTSLISAYTTTKSALNYNTRNNLLINNIEELHNFRKKQFDKDIINFSQELLYENYKVRQSPNSLLLEYLVENLDESTQLFGDDFNSFNDKNCLMLIDGIKEKFTKDYDFKTKGKHTVEIKLKDPSNLTSLACLCYGCTDLYSISFNNFNTENVVHMACMCFGCSKLNHVNFTNFNTEKVTHMACMFTGCVSLANLDLTAFNTSKVTRMNHMFEGCSALTTVNLSSFNTENVTHMNHMFEGCSALTTLNLSSFKTTKVTNMFYLFAGCSKLVSLNLSTFDTTNVIDMQYMFHGCSSLVALNLGNFNTTKVTHMNHMFKGCSSLVTLHLDNFNTGSVVDMYSMFEGCGKLTSISLSNFDTSKVVSMQNMFSGCSALRELDLNKFNTKHVNNMKNMFYGCSSMTNVLVDHFNTSNCLSMENMFYGCSSLMSLNLNSFTSEKIRFMDNMFYGCSSLTSLEMNNFTADNVRNMSNVFEGCVRLNVSGFESRFNQG